MKNKCRFLVVAFVLALVTTSCGANIKSPLMNIKTRPTQTVDIQVPKPEAATSVELNLEFVASELKLSPGASEYLASGTATFNANDFEPKIEVLESSNKLRVGGLKVEGISTCPDKIINVWDLQLAYTPMSLNIKAGAYEGSFELGGLYLWNLTISDEGSDFMGRFSEPNNDEMSSFTYNTEAGCMELKCLANANFAQMTFTSGVGDYTLSFDGDLPRDANVTIESNLSTVNIIAPEGVDARVTIDGSPTTVNIVSGWKQNGNIYAHSRSDPTIDITVKMETGSLNLKIE